MFPYLDLVLSIYDVIVSQKENENSISLDGIIILLALFAQKNIFGQLHAGGGKNLATSVIYSIVRKRYKEKS